MPPFEGSQFILFLAFFVPGFVSIKIYDLLWPSERRDWSKAVVEAIGFSAVNFAALSPIIYPTLIGYAVFANPLVQIGVALVALLIAPAIWPMVLHRVFSKSGLLVDPVHKPWDVVFKERGACWIIVHLKDGRRVGGRFGPRSVASSSPAEEQLYLEEVWELDAQGAFLHAIDRSAGILMSARDIQAIEFFE
jgi:Family of unknown function (DUF6338)